MNSQNFNHVSHLKCNEGNVIIKPSIEGKIFFQSCTEIIYLFILLILRNLIIRWGLSSTEEKFLSFDAQNCIIMHIQCHVSDNMRFQFQFLKFFNYYVCNSREHRKKWELAVQSGDTMVDKHTTITITLSPGSGEVTMERDSLGRRHEMFDGIRQTLWMFAILLIGWWVPGING